MKLKILIVLLIPLSTLAQKKGLEFNRKYFECEDKWVVFPKSKEDTAYMYGFLYLDEQAGFTFNLESKLKILDSGKFYGFQRDSNYNIKVRLAPETKLLAIIPNEKLEELNLPFIPEWLTIYKESNDSIQSLIDRGYHYNHVGGSDLALSYLEKAYKYNKHADGLEFELAFAYNATEQYNKAIPVLKAAIENNKKNEMFYRELGFALIGANRIEEAEQVYLKGIKISRHKNQKSEMAINMAQAFYNAKNKEKFMKWSKLTKKYTEKDSPYLKYLEYFEKTINN